MQLVLIHPDDDLRWDNVALALFGLRAALPAFLFSVLCVLALWRLLLIYGRRMCSGILAKADGRGGDLDLDAENDGLGGRQKPEKKKSKKQLQEEAKLKFRPRRLLLVAPLLFLSFSYIVQAAGILLVAVTLRHGHVDGVALWPALVAAAAYWLPAILLIGSRDPDCTDAEHYVAITVVSVVMEPCILAVLAVLTYTHARVDALQLMALVLSSLRSVLAIALACAYLPQFQEEVVRDEPSDEAIALLDEDANRQFTSENIEPTGGQDASEQDNTDSDTDKKEDADEKEEEEEDDNNKDMKKPRAYDLAAMYTRLRGLLPYLVPLESHAVQGIVALCIVLTLVNSAMSVLLPRQTGILVAKLAAGESPWSAIFLWCIFSLACSRNGALFTLRSVLWSPVDQRAARELDVLAFGQVLNLSARFHNDSKTGELLSVLNRTSDASGLLQLVLFYIIPILVDLASAMTYLTVVYGFSLTATALCTSLAYITVVAYARGGLIYWQTESLERADQVSGNKNEAISQIDIVKYFSAETLEINRYRKGTLLCQLLSYQQQCFNKLTQFAEGMVTQMGVLVGALIVASQIARGERDVGSFVAYSAYMLQLLDEISQLAMTNNYSLPRWACAHSHKLVDVLDERNEIIDKEDAEELLNCRGEIEFDNVSFIYEKPKTKADKDKEAATTAQGGAGSAVVDAEDTSETDTQENGNASNGDTTDGNVNGNASGDAHRKKKGQKEPRKVVQNISFKVKPGQHVAFVGETGSGKSTLFKLLFRFFDVTEGCIRVDGKDIREYTQHSLRQALGVIQQEGSLFNASIMDNIRYGNIQATDAQVMDAARIANIHDRVRRWPKKYHTVVGERGVKLSGGEKQRVSIARTLLKNPDVLLLDEATSALDTHTEKEIQAQLRKLTEGKTTLAIAHRLSTISYADMIIVLKEGKIQEAGTHEELIKIDGGHYKKLWEAQINTGKPVEAEQSAMAPAEDKKEGVLVDVSIPGEEAVSRAGKADDASTIAAKITVGTEAGTESSSEAGTAAEAGPSSEEGGSK